MKGSLIISVLMIVIVAAALWEARDWDVTTRLFPWVIGFPLLGLLILQLIFNLSGLRGDHPVELPVRTDEERRRGIGTVAWLLGFAGTVWLFGFGIGGPFATLGYLRLSAGEKWSVALIITISVGILIWILAEFLYIPFPRGFLFKVLQD